MGTSDSDREPVERLAEEFLERHRRGEKPDLAEYTTKYPQWANAILDLFPALLMMEQMRPVSENLTASRSLGTKREDFGAGIIAERLGDYRLLREVGRGGMGIVYEAVQESLSRHVALKILPSSALLDARQRQRFEREARASARLHHTNIVPVFGVGEHDGLQYYVMQFIQGQSLDQVMAELHRFGKSPAKTRGPVAGKVGEDRGHLDTYVDRRVSGSAAGMAAQLLSGQFAPGRVTQGTEGHRSSSLTETQPLTSAGRHAEPPKRESPQPTGPPDQPSERKPAPPGALAASPPLAPGSGEGSSSVSGLLTGSTSSLSLVRAFRHYAESVSRIGIQASEALHYAHGQGIVHRDVKPANLLLDLQGNVWVTDFGLAKAADEIELTHTGDLIGTLRYMAPERFQGRSDARSDIYALGLTLYELLAMRPAFEGSDRNSLIHKVTNESPPPLRRIDPRVPRDLETIVTKAIDREPARRYQTAGEMAEDLRRFMEDKPIRARRIRLPEQAWRWSRRNPALAGMTALMLVLLGVVAVGSSFAALWFKDLARSERLDRRAAELHSRTAEQQRHEAVLSRKQAESARKQEAAERGRAEQARAEAQANLVEAQRQRERAEASFRQARAAVDDSLTRISENNLLNVPGLRPLRRELIEAALKYYLGFVQQRGDEPELQKDLAAAYTRVGRITSDLGSKGDALKSYRQAIGIQTELARRALDRERPAALAELARSHQAVGRLARELGEGNQAETSFAQAETLWRRAAHQEPGNPELQNGLADCLSDASAQQESAGELERAAQLYREALLIQRKLVGDHPKHPQIARFRQVLARQYLGMGHLRLGLKLSPETFIHVLGNEFPLSSDPLFFEKQSQEILQGLVRDFPTHEKINEFRRDLAETSESIGAFQADKNQSEDALRSFQEALALREQLARENPTVPDLQSELAQAYSSIGKVFSRHQRWSEALPQLGRAVERQRLVAMLAPEDEARRSVLGRLLGELARSKSKLGRSAEAARDYGEARDLLGQLSSPGPSDLYDLAAVNASESTLVGREQGKAQIELTAIDRDRRQALSTAAIGAFQKAIAAGFLDLELARHDSDLDPLRSRDDFKALLEQLARIRQGIVWVLDKDDAQAQATREKKDLFIYFSGSDWCPWCVLFHRTVLSKPAFIEQVPKNFVMVQLDQPVTKPKPANSEKIAELTQRWLVSGIPTVILADAQGKPYARIMNDASEEARARYIDNLVAAQKVRANRDLALARAKSAQGLERAKHLDAALGVLPGDLVEIAYGDLIAEIVALDAKDEAGLRTRYERSGEARVRTAARAAFAKRDWTGVIQLVNGLKGTLSSADSQPVDLTVDDYTMRGSAHAELGQFEEAEADYAKVLESMSLLRPPLTAAERIYRRTLLLVATGRLDDYRLTCEGLLDLAEAEPDPMTARDVLLSLRLAPSAVPDRTRAVQLAEKNFGGAAKDFISLRVLGQTYYRADRFADAIDRLNQAVKIYEADPKLQKSLDADGLFSTDGLFLAMAHHRLGHAEEARRSLDQVRQRWEGALKLFQKDPTAGPNRWPNRLATLLLRSEAEALIEGSPESDDPVAETAHARAEIRLGNWDRAISHFNRALKQLPGDLRLTLERGRCHARLGRHEQAAADFAEIIGMKLRVLEARHAAGDGKSPSLESLESLSAAYHDLATTQREAGLRDEAVATYRKIQALWPGHAVQLFRVASGLARCFPPVAPGVRNEAQSPDSSLAELAVDVLKQAALAGFTDSRQVRVAMSFEPLRSRPEYAALVQQIQRSDVLPLTSGELRRYVGHQHDWVEGVAATRDGRRILSVGNDQKPRLWDVESGQELRRFDGHGAAVYGVALTPDGQRAVTCGQDGTVRVWNVGTGQELRRIPTRSGRDQKLALAPDGRRVLAGATDGTLGLWDIETGKLVRQFHGSSDPALTVALSSDGRRALSGGRDHWVSLWDVDGGTLIKRLQGHRGTVWCATFTPDCRCALTAGGDGRVILWDLESGQPLRDFVGHWEPVRCVALLPSTRRFVSGSQGGRLIVWDLETGRELYRLIGPAGVLSLDPLPDGRRVVTAEMNGIVRLQDISEASARFRDLARLGQWEQALTLDPTPRDPRLRLGLAWCGAQNQQWDKATADPSLAAPQAEGMGIRQIPVLDPLLEEQLRSARGPAAKVIFINLTRRFFNGYALDHAGRRQEFFTLVTGEGFVLDCEAKDCLLLTEKDGKSLGLVVAGPGVNLLVVSEGPRSIDIGLPRDPEYVDLLVQTVAAHGRSELAENFLAQVQKQMPGDPRIDQAIAHVYARWGLWDKAASVLTRRLERDPSDHGDWYSGAVLYLQRGDLEGYRRHCRRMLDRFVATDDPTVAGRTAKVCLLTGEKVDDQNRPEQLAERALRAGGQAESLKWSQQAKALAEYRQGRFSSALEWIGKSRALDADHAQHYLETENLLIAALAHQRLDHSAEALGLLGQANQLFERLPAPGQPDYGGPWSDWLTCQTIRLEAERLIGVHSPKTANAAGLPPARREGEKAR